MLNGSILRNRLTGRLRNYLDIFSRSSPTPVNPFFFVPLPFLAYLYLFETIINSLAFTTHSSA